MIDLQPLFAAPIIEQYAYPAAYTDHTNDIWRVHTATETAVVRAPRPAAELDSPFWRGCRHLFGLDPTDTARLATTNALFGSLSPLPIPCVLRSGTVAGRQCLVVEHLPGERLDDLRTLPAATLAALGATIAQIHRQRYPWFGTPNGSTQQPLTAFHTRLADTLRLLATGHTDPTLSAPLEELCAAAFALPAPTAATLVMIDVDATQFLTDGTRLTALVDTDAYAIAPPALDLIGYEYELDAPAAAAFAAGYRTIAPLPDLTAVRPVYRYLYRLLETQGAVPLDAWLAWPRVFEE